jgi:hypothetical protein
VPSAAEGIVDGRYSISDRVAHVIHGVRESAGKALTGGGEDGVRDVATQATGVPGGARGAGAAGTGVLAKLAGLGTAGKLAAVCLGGGAAATACLAAGIVPAALPGGDAHGARTDPGRPAAERSRQLPAHRPAAVLPWELNNETADPPPPASGDGAGDDTSQEPVSDPQPAPPIAPSAPPTQQGFGVASAGSGSPGSTSSSTSGAGGSTVQREFGP